MLEVLPRKTLGRINAAKELMEKIGREAGAEGCAGAAWPGRERGTGDGRERGMADGRERGMADGRERGTGEGRERGMAEGRERGTGGRRR
jgi:hypothetical protein